MFTARATNAYGVKSAFVHNIYPGESPGEYRLEWLEASLAAFGEAAITKKLLEELGTHVAKLLPADHGASYEMVQVLLHFDGRGAITKIVSNLTKQSFAVTDMDIMRKRDKITIRANKIEHPKGKPLARDLTKDEFANEFLKHKNLMMHKYDLTGSILMDVVILEVKTVWTTAGIPKAGFTFGIVGKVGTYTEWVSSNSKWPGWFTLRVGNMLTVQFDEVGMFAAVGIQEVKYKMTRRGLKVKELR